MRTLFLLTAVLAAPLVSAQSSETYIEQAGMSLDQSAQDIALTSAVYRQALDRSLVGTGLDSNTASVSAQGDGNVALVSQRGYGNRLGLDITGSFNEVDLYQRGIDNLLLADITGDGNRLVDSFQAGSDNVYRLRLDGVDNTEHSIRQYGPGNTASQVVGAGMTPASIEQYGGAEISIIRR